jgi:subtilisin family serine protease
MARMKQAPGQAEKETKKGRKQKDTATPERIAHLKPHEHAAATRQEYVPGLLVVKCKTDVVANVPDIHAARLASVRTLSLPKAVEDPFQNLSQKQLIREVIPIFSRLTQGRSLSVAPMSVAASFAMSVRDSENEDLRGINMLRLSRSANLPQIEKELAGTPGIEYVHRVPRRWMSARSKSLPHDPMVKRQWNLGAIRWFNANPLPDASTVKVAVLDTGVDITHPELQNIIKVYIHEGASSSDIIGHGTHVSGIISAEINNNIGIAGVCHCDLSVWKIFGDTPDPTDGEYYVDDVMYQRALNAARNAGMQVVNLSIGGTGHSRTEEFLFRRLLNAGATVVAAMGNEFKAGNPTEYPAAYPGVIAVGAIGKSNRRASFSNTGSHIVISAPGLNILSTLPMTWSAARDKSETKYAVWSGTSMATPHISAAAALIIARHPNLSPQQIADRLKSTATKLSAMGNKPHTREYGSGLLNIESAVS